ncbi:hypothetical protein HG531_010243 [Fusarium graminearum]|nr:hypothetical protein HG531_010243 [Fusarium graminearum]
MASQADYKDRQFLAVIGDEDSVTGLLLAGIGHVTTGADAQKNFLVVDGKTDTSAIEAAFDRFTEDRKDIGIVLINQHIAERIRHRIDTYTAAFPAVLEIPSKDHPYDPEKDSAAISLAVYDSRWDEVEYNAMDSFIKRNLSRKVYGLNNLDLALFDGTLEVNVTNLLAEIGLGADEADETILDSQENVSALFNLLLN